MSFRHNKTAIELYINGVELIYGSRWQVAADWR